MLGISFGAGVVFFTMFRQSSPAYVFSHELTHWLAAKLFGRRTGRFRVRAHRRSVDIERPNVWITLAPYAVPLYTLLWIGSCGIAGIAIGGAGTWTRPTAYAGIGITYAFHVTYTLHCLRLEQADLARYGRLFSLSLILFCNVLLLTLFAMASSGAWERGAKLAVRLTQEEVRWCVAWVRTLF